MHGHSDSELIKKALLEIRRLKSQLSQYGNQTRKPIAIVGASCQLPGGVSTLDEYWELIREGESGIADIPKNKWDVDQFFDPNPLKPGKIYCRRMGVIFKEKPFDRTFFSISENEASKMDPQQRLLITLVKEALETFINSLKRENFKDTGVFVSIGGQDYQYNLSLDDIDAHVASGCLSGFAPGRISHYFGFEGPSMLIDTSCSSALTALSQACVSLRRGECSMAVVGSVSLMVSPYSMITACKTRLLSSDGESRPFDQDANGFSIGEGGVVVLKTLNQAKLDGNSILAIIHGISIGHNGIGLGLGLPDCECQANTIIQAFASSEIEPHDVGYIETHGVGSPVGDVMEMEAIKQAYGLSKRSSAVIGLGAVKANIGHLGNSSGIASLLKTILVLQNGVIPSLRNLKKPTDKIDWRNLALVLPQNAMPWLNGNSRRIAGINSFALSGANAHVLLSSYH